MCVSLEGGQSAPCLFCRRAFAASAWILVLDSSGCLMDPGDAIPRRAHATQTWTWALVLTCSARGAEGGRRELGLASADAQNGSQPQYGLYLRFW